MTFAGVPDLENNFYLLWQDPELEEGVDFLPSKVWKGLMFIFGHVAGLGYSIGNYIFPFNYPVAFLILFVPIFNKQIIYLGIIPYVLIQEYVFKGGSLYNEF